MTQDVALYRWFNSFGVPFYPTTALPPADEIVFPYGTYEPIFSGRFDEVYPTVNLYFLTESEAIPNQKAFEMFNAIGESGVSIECDEGILWVKRNKNFCTAIIDPDNSNIKRRLISIAIEFLTNN